MQDIAYILAGPADAFDNDLVNTFIQPIFYLIGGAILLMTVWRAIGGFAKGDFGKVARTCVGGFVAVLLCFNLSLAATLADSATGLMETVVTTISDVLGGGGGSEPADAPGSTTNPGSIPPPPPPTK
jgi:hypothetical protein